MGKAVTFNLLKFLSSDLRQNDSRYLTRRLELRSEICIV